MSGETERDRAWKSSFISVSWSIAIFVFLFQKIREKKEIGNNFIIWNCFFLSFYNEGFGGEGCDDVVVVMMVLLNFKQTKKALFSNMVKNCDWF